MNNTATQLDNTCIMQLYFAFRTF